MKDKKIVYIKPFEIKKSREFIRQETDTSLNKLIESIKVCGIINPLLIRVNERSEYEIISGNRRLDAALFLGLKSVPCIIKRSDALNSLLFSLQENTNKQNLNFFEEAKSLYALVSKYKLSLESAAKKACISPSALNRKISLLKLNSVLQERIIKEDLSEEFAFLLLKLPEEERENILDKIVKENLNLKES